jgi:hypothetical protein
MLSHGWVVHAKETFNKELEFRYTLVSQNPHYKCWGYIVGAHYLPTTFILRRTEKQMTVSPSNVFLVILVLVLV